MFFNKLIIMFGFMYSSARGSDSPATRTQRAWSVATVDPRHPWLSGQVLKCCMLRVS